MGGPSNHSSTKPNNARDSIAQRLAELNSDHIHPYSNIPQKHTKTSLVMTSSPPKHKPFTNDSDDDDGVRGFTLRLTQVQVSEE